MIYMTYPESASQSASSWAASAATGDPRGDAASWAPAALARAETRADALTRSCERLEARLVLDARAQLGECIRWDAEARVLWWVDIDRHRLHRFDPVSGSNETMEIGEAIGCFAQDTRGGFIAGLRSGFARITRFGGAIVRLAGPLYDPARERFDDGRCDFQGRFWAGTMWEPRDAAAGALWRLDPNGRMSAHAQGVVISNAITFSPDGTRMTFADSPAHTIWACDYDAARGLPSNPRPIRRYEPASGRPDGAATDAEGNLWVAVIQGGRVEKLSPDGRLLAVVDVPVPCPTCCTLGGPGRRTLYITTGRIRMTEDELAALPSAGGVYAVDLPAHHAPGIIEPRYAG